MTSNHNILPTFTRWMFSTLWFTSSVIRCTTTWWQGDLEYICLLQGFQVRGSLSCTSRQPIFLHDAQKFCFLHFLFWSVYFRFFYFEHLIPSRCKASFECIWKECLPHKKQFLAEMINDTNLNIMSINTDPSLTHTARQGSHYMPGEILS